MNQVLGFGAWVLGVTTIILMILACLTNSRALLTATVITGIPAMTLAFEGAMADLKKRDHK
jgi:hypothetical protein